MLKPLAIFPLVTLFICHNRKSYQIVSSGTNIGICKKKYKYRVQFFLHYKISVSGSRFSGSSTKLQILQYYICNISNVIIKYSVVRILHIFPLQSCTIFGHLNIGHFSVTKLYKMVLQILHIFLLQSCTKWSSKYCIFSHYKVVQNGPPNIPYFSLTKLYKMVLQLLHIFPLQSCTKWSSTYQQYFLFIE